MHGTGSGCVDPDVLHSQIWLGREPELERLMVRSCSSSELPVLCWVGSFRNHLRRRRIAEANVYSSLAGVALAAPFAVLFPLAATPTASLVLLAGMNFFAGFPFAGGYAALQELTPNRMRAQATAVLILFINLIGGGFGATLVAMLTDFVFRDEKALPLALSLSAVLTLPVAALLLVVLLRSTSTGKRFSMIGSRVLPGVAAAVGAILCSVGVAASGDNVEKLVSSMTLEEKIDLIGGTGFATKEIARVGIPPFKMSDGPVGARSPAPSTAYAAGIGLAASWDPSLAEEIGVQLGRDARARGARFLLGPGVNVYRAPMNGRNFEYFGEDPFLGRRIAVGYVKGVQESRRLRDASKHYIGNNSEFARHTRIRRSTNARCARSICRSSKAR